MHSGIWHFHLERKNTINCSHGNYTLHLNKVIHCDKCSLFLERIFVSYRNDGHYFPTKQRNICFSVRYFTIFTQEFVKQKIHIQYFS